MNCIYYHFLEAWAPVQKLSWKKPQLFPQILFLFWTSPVLWLRTFTVTGVPTEFNSTNPEDHYKQADRTHCSLNLNDGSYASVIVEKSIEVKIPKLLRANQIVHTIITLAIFITFAVMVHMV